MAVQNLRERIQQKYHINLDDVRSECITITYATRSGQGEDAHAGGNGGERRGHGWDAVAQQIETLQKRLDEIGPVNLVAIEEYEETESVINF